MDLNKSAPRHITLTLCFCIWWDLRVTQCIPVHLGHEKSTHYFWCSGGRGADCTKIMRGHITVNSCVYIPQHLRVK
jgi:hypothetical protein